MEERFAKYPDDDKTPLKYWGDPGRYEKFLGVTVRPTSQFYSATPIIQFNHPDGYDQLTRKLSKRLGSLRAIELPTWGRAEDVLKYHRPSQNKQKQLWEKLAEKNSMYYIFTSKGRGITKEQFRESGKQAYKKYILEDERIEKKGIILDLGCGTGRITEFMAADFDEVIGMDISNRMIAEGRERLKGKDNVRLMETDGQSVPIISNSVDFVFSYLVFQHIKTREMVERSFKDIHRVLKRGGLFKVLLRSDKQKNMNNWWAGVHHDEKAVDKLCKSVGFKIVERTKYDEFGFWLLLEK
jgi:SAM-dependent methyltransferase